MPRLPAAVVLAAGLLLTASAADEKDAARNALKQVGDYVGEWKGNGEARAGGRNALWKETLSWSWKFKGRDAWIALSVKDGKYVTAGELRYDPRAKLYRLTLTDADKKRRTFEGTLARDRLVLRHKDAATGDVSRVTLYTLADGARMIVRSEVQAKGRGPYTDVFRVAATRAGESFAGGGKKPVCVVTGGLGTIPVSYGGKTYHVCCTGCRDEFNADPKKYVDEFEKNKK
ncbi:MAG TPA: YHS domain-containing protein [Fimbriiglobus sp.]|nr:YHS domain-containing protein [Fimbriiglobus sp.]